MAKDYHDVRDHEGKFAEADPFDMRSRIPPAGSAARSSADEFSSLYLDLTSNIRARMASGANNVGDRLDHPAAGSDAGGRDYARDKSASVEAQRAAKAPTGQVRRAPENDWDGPQPLGGNAYNTNWRGRDDGNTWG